MSKAGLIGAQSIVIEQPTTKASELDSPDREGLELFLEPGSALPTKGITMFYGRRNRALIGHIYNDEHNYGNRVQFSGHKVKVGRYTPTKRSLEQAIEDRLLTIPTRLRASAMDEINQHWNELILARGGEPEDFPRRMSENMHLLDELIECPPFDQLTAVSYFMQTICGPTQFITVFDRDAIQEDPMYPGCAVPPYGVTRRFVSEG